MRRGERDPRGRPHFRAGNLRGARLQRRLRPPSASSSLDPPSSSSKGAGRKPPGFTGGGPDISNRLMTRLSESLYNWRDDFLLVHLCAYCTECSKYILNGNRYESFDSDQDYGVCEECYARLPPEKREMLIAEHQPPLLQMLCAPWLLVAALQRGITFCAPGCHEMSFDEAWLLRAIRCNISHDKSSLAFLLKSRVKPATRPHLMFLIKKISLSLR